jgi:putative transposase
MKYDPNKHHRKSIRLKGYDYTQAGAYFVTICTYHRDEIFGEIINGEMKLSPLGRIVHEEWLRSAEMRPEIRLFDDELSIMPNHSHGIIWIVDPPAGADRVRPNDDPRPNEGNQQIIDRASAIDPKQQDARGASQQKVSLRRAPGSLGSIMAGFKASVTSRAKQELNMTGIWQKNYYDHIIRNDRELNNIRWYIVNNPGNWQLDRDNSQNSRKLPPPEKVEEYVKDVADMVLKLKTGNS